MRQATERPTKGSIDELLRGATSREVWKNADSLSGSLLERVVIDGEPFVLKHLHVDDDWIQRAIGDVRTRPYVMWTSGLFDRLPASIDHTTIEMASGLGRNGWGVALLMHDVSPYMVRVADGVIPLEQHLRFIDHMADLHAHFWGFKDTAGLQPMAGRYLTFTPWMSDYENGRDDTDPVPSMVPDGWTRMADESPALGKIIGRLLAEPWPLVDAQQRAPKTLVHADWKAGNLGSHPDGRTILLDWAWPGEAPGLLDLAWYIAVNCDLLPNSKQETIAAYRASLESRGIDTTAWWDEQLDLALLGALLLLGWSKSGAELAWWVEPAVRASRLLD